MLVILATISNLASPPGGIGVVIWGSTQVHLVLLEAWQQLLVLPFVRLLGETGGGVAFAASATGCATGALVLLAVYCHLIIFNLVLELEYQRSYE